MSVLLELASRCEAADRPDRELDDAIMVALLFRRESRHIGAQEEQNDGSWAPVKDEVWVDPLTDKWVGTHAREFTSSIDAAITIVPNTHWWEVVQTCAPTSPMRNFGLRKGMFKAEVGEYGGDRGVASNDKPALALCAAALRARAASRAVSEPASMGESKC